MPTFTYAGRDPEGRPVGGTIEAPSSVVASHHLEQQGIIVLEIRQEVEYHSSLFRRAFGPILFGVALGSLMTFYRQFANLLQSGMLVSQALNALSQSAPSGRLRRIAARARDHTEKGGKLAEALAEYPWIFDRLQMALIETGESSGGLDIMVSRCSEYLERENELRNLLRVITFYPKIVLVVAAGISYSFARFVFFQVFPPAAMLVFAVWLILRIGNQSPSFRGVWDLIKLCVPFIGGAVRGLAAARFSNALALLYQSGVPITDAIKTAATASGNVFIEKNILRVAPMLDQGHTISETLTRAGVLPRIVMSMLTTGEQTGAIDTSMEKAREYLEVEGRTKMAQIAWAVAIGLYLAVAMVVLFILMQFYGGYAGGMMG